MPDRKKVISHFQDALQASGDNNKWRFVRADIIEDAIALLKAQEPHVMTLEDVEDALDTVVWVDRPMLENTSSEYALIDSYSRAQKIVVLQYPFNSEYKERSDYATYGKRWRCWTSRPTDEQRKATPWEPPKEG